MFIYMTICKVNNKKYIGYCTREDDNYLGSGIILKQAIEKYGVDNFERIILETCETKEELYEAEKKWIAYYNAVSSEDFYNISHGGFGGDSETVKRYWASLSEEEKRERLKNWCHKKGKGFTGKTHTEESKKLIGSKSKDRNWHKPTNYSGSGNPRALKVKIIDETGERIFDCLKDYSIITGIPYSTLKGIKKKFEKPGFKFRKDSKYQNIKGIYEL